MSCVVQDGNSALVRNDQLRVVARRTQDSDIVYSRTPENLSRLMTALAEYKPYLRGVPPGLRKRAVGRTPGPQPVP